MANTYTAIATVTVGSGGAANIEFTSIPGTYTDLQVLICAREESTNSTTLYLRFNGDTGANYNRRDIQGDGSSAASYSGTGETKANAMVIVRNTDTASTFSNAALYIPNYANTSNYKSWSVDSVTEANATQAYTRFTAGIWNSNSAITSLTLLLDSGDIAQYSTATLYGIKNS